MSTHSASNQKTLHYNPAPYQRETPKSLHNISSLQKQREMELELEIQQNIQKQLEIDKTLEQINLRSSRLNIKPPAEILPEHLYTTVPSFEVPSDLKPLLSYNKVFQSEYDRIQREYLIIQKQKNLIETAEQQLTKDQKKFMNDLYEFQRSSTLKSSQITTPSKPQTPTMLHARSNLLYAHSPQYADYLQKNENLQIQVNKNKTVGEALVNEVQNQSPLRYTPYGKQSDIRSQSVQVQFNQAVKNQTPTYSRIQNSPQVEKIQQQYLVQKQNKDDQKPPLKYDSIEAIELRLKQIELEQQLISEKHGPNPNLNLSNSRFQHISPKKQTKIYENNYIYEGRLNQQGQRVGYGTLKNKTGFVIYQGNWLDDKYHGSGKLFNEDPEILFNGFNYKDFRGIGAYWMKYEGDFLFGSMSGNGILELSNEERLTGTFYAGKVNGQAEFQDKSGVKTRGLYRDDKLVKIY